MEKNRSVFVDSNYFVAFFNTNDTLHKKAVNLAKELERNNLTILISNFIFLETVTVLAQRVGKEIALRVGRYLLEDPKINMLHIDAELQNAAWLIFQEIKDKNISFVDCSNLAVLRSEDGAELLTFDETDFKKLKRNYKFNLFR